MCVRHNIRIYKKFYCTKLVQSNKGICSYTLLTRRLLCKSLLKLLTPFKFAFYSLDWRAYITYVLINIYNFLWIGILTILRFWFIEKNYFTKKTSIICTKNNYLFFFFYFIIICNWYVGKKIFIKSKRKIIICSERNFKIFPYFQIAT